MAGIATAGQAAFDEIKALIGNAIESNKTLKGASFHAGPVTPANLRFPAIIVMQRVLTALDETFQWGVARLRLRIDIVASRPDRDGNLAKLETLSDALVEVLWADRRLNGKARETHIEEIGIGESDERPDQVSASLVIAWDVSFDRPGG